MTAAQPKPRTVREPAYLAFLRRCTCSWCGRPPPSEAAHHGPHGIGIKADDRGAVALCPTCHRFSHDQGTLPPVLVHARNADDLHAMSSGAGLREWARLEALRLRARYATLTDEDAW